MTLAGSTGCDFSTVPPRKTHRRAELSGGTPHLVEVTDTLMTYVLVPGGYQGAWSWLPVARRLRAAGHAAVTMTLPGFADGDPRTGWHLSDAVEHVVAEVERRDLKNVVLVGQSWAGYPITGAAHRLVGRLAEVVYYTAIVPARGVPLIDENVDYAAMLYAQIGASPDGSVAATSPCSPTPPSPPP